MTKDTVVALRQPGKARPAPLCVWPTNGLVGRRLWGTDPTNDLAVLRIGVTIGSPPALPIGSSAELRVAQP